MPAGYEPLVQVAMVSLAVYALLLGGGGFFGYYKAGSKPSLIAGTATAAVALASFGLAFSGIGGFWLGLILAVMMIAMFAIRYRKSGRFMPSGMLAVLSVVEAVLLGLAISRLRG